MKSFIVVAMKSFITPLDPSPRNVFSEYSLYVVYGNSNSVNFISSNMHDFFHLLW
jgi:hypothetical protein